MMASLRGATRYVGRGLIALAAAVAVFYAGALVLAAILLARDEFSWHAVYLYDDGVADLADSRRELLDVYAQPPLSAAGWLLFAILVVVAYAIVVWGLWLIVRVFAGARGREGSGRRWPDLVRVAVNVFAWGIVTLSAYSLVIFLWGWVEWWHVLDAGLTFPGDPKPEPSPAFDPWQIPLGIVLFAVIGALPLVVRAEPRKRRKVHGVGNGVAFRKT